MHRNNRRGASNRHRNTAVAVTAGFLVSGVLVWQSSYAAFSDSTTNPGNSWTAGQVDLSDNKNGTALFAVTSMVPGTTGSKCIVVTYSGDVATAVRMYGAYTDADANSVPDATGLASYVELAVQEGSGSQEDCSDFSPTSTLYGTQPAFDATKTANHFVTNVGSYATGVSSWAPSSTASRTYKISYQLKDNDLAQGQSLKLDFVWEARSTP